MASRFGSLITRAIAPVLPGLALKRELALLQLSTVQKSASSYNVTGGGDRTKDFRYNRADAGQATRHSRARLAWITRDMVRNNPRAVRIRRQLINSVVGAGIQPVVAGDGLSQSDKDAITRLIGSHCLTSDFDADGKLTLRSLQTLAFGTIVQDGEVLLRRRFRRASDGFGLNFQVQVLEADYLNTLIDGRLPNGNFAEQGIEFNAIGKPVAYHLFREHPGGRRGAMPATSRVDASNVIHAFEPTRPGQRRGVSWLAPVMTLLHELQKYQDGQVKRQEIAALFAGILKTTSSGEELGKQFEGLSAGSILEIGEDEHMDFTDPPEVDGYEAFMRVTDRAIASAMGMTYEALTGDYSQVNYVSGRMGRMDVDPNVRDWQHNILIDQICVGLSRWIAEGIEDVLSIDRTRWGLTWTPPVRPVVDPTKDYKATETAMRAGLTSRRAEIRKTGQDPATIEAEIRDERAAARTDNVVLTSDPGQDASRLAHRQEEDTNDDA